MTSLIIGSILWIVSTLLAVVLIAKAVTDHQIRKFFKGEQQ
jgi:hypothetical protein